MPKQRPGIANDLFVFHRKHRVEIPICIRAHEAFYQPHGIGGEQ
jgi:hypothetical protein